MRISATLTAGHTRLVPLNPGFLPQLHQLELSPELSFRWRHHGAHPNPSDFEAGLWQCLCNFVVLSDERPVGIVSAYDQDFLGHHCKVAAAKFGVDSGGLSVITGVFLLIDYLLQGWPFQKLYFESPEYNAKQFRSACGTILHEEGRLKNHVFLDGEYADLLVLALYRSEWSTYSEKWFASRQRVSSVQFKHA